LLAQLSQHPLDPIGFDCLDRLAVNAGRTLVASNLFPGSPQHIESSYSVKERMEPPRRFCFAAT
jgi:hypothetical protein